MVNPVSKSLLLYPGLAFALTVIFGFWLSRLGKPYQQILFTIHKLLALAVVVMVGVGFRNWVNSGAVQPECILQVILFAFLTVILFASGALLSLEKLDYKLLRLLHRIAPVGLVLLGVMVLI